MHMKLAVSAKVLPESSEYFRSSKSMSGPGLSGVCIQARHSAAPGHRSYEIALLALIVAMISLLVSIAVR